MEKISLKGVSHVLSEKEMKNVMGGSGGVTVTFVCMGRYASLWKANLEDVLRIIAPVDHPPVTARLISTKGGRQLPLYFKHLIIRNIEQIIDFINLKEFD